MKTLRLLLVFAVTVMPHGQMLFAQEIQQNWPREIDTPEADIVMYQPQLETFKGDHLTARAAVSVTPKGETEATFGAVWLDAKVSTDRDTRTVKCLQVNVSQAKFPNADPAKVDKLKELLSNEIPKWDMTISLDRLLTMLELVEKEQKAAGQLETTPPEIMIVEHPAVLISIDGKPILDKVEGSDLMRVANTPFFIVLDPGSKQYYLKGDNWLSAKELDGSWEETESVPETVLAEAAKSEESVGSESDELSGDQKPQVIVVTEPTELIVLDGKVQYSPISGADLLYVSNTDRDIFMDIDSQRHYILLSGRWYTSKSLDGKKWKYVSNDKLPEVFAKIPGGSTKENVLASVPDTLQANEAILETYIPQTSTIVRDEAKLNVTYDGTPEFESIKGTGMTYAINTPNSVIQYENRYYCCNEGVWFVSGNAQGPWVVCDAVPDAIYTIPPSCPIYHVKYVYVYGSTPTVVYMGYTPGYTGSYVYSGTVVYGTGYVYRGWHGTHYYPYPVTYGYAPVYQPYSGWSFAAGLAVGWIASRAYHDGWWGSRGYRDVRYSHNVNINRNIYNRPSGGRPGGVRPGDRPGRPGGGGRPGRPGGGRPGDRPVRPGGDRPSRPGGDRPSRPSGDRPTTGRPGEGRPSTMPKTRRPNNVYADRNGNIHRRTDSGWQRRDSQGWSQQQRRTPATDRSRPTQQRRPSNLDRQHSARQRGTARTNNYQRSRSSGGGGRSRGSAPSRGGGRSGGSRGGGSRGGGRGGGGRGGRR